MDLSTLVEEFLCKNKTDMVFRSNPYDDKAVTGNSPKNEFVLNFGCESFSIYDTETETDQTVVHYFMKKELDFRSRVYEQSLNESFFINRTGFNEQDFQLTFHKDLEFLQIQGTQLYIFSQDP